MAKMIFSLVDFGLVDVFYPVMWFNWFNWFSNLATDIVYPRTLLST